MAWVSVWEGLQMTPSELELLLSGAIFGAAFASLSLWAWIEGDSALRAWWKGRG